MDDAEKVRPVLKKIMQSMKTKEQVACIVKPEYLQLRDPLFVTDFGVDMSRDLLMDITMKHLVRVDDVYKDQSTFSKTI